MPRLDMTPGGAVDSFELPHSGITIVMRRKASGRDKNEAMQACLGEGFNPRHSYTRYLCYMAALLIVSWDVTEDDGEGGSRTVPVTPQTLASIDDEKDYEKILDEAAARVTLREADPVKEAPFGTPSTPSSPDTN